MRRKIELAASESRISFHRRCIFLAMRLLFSGTQPVYYFFFPFFFNERGKLRYAARLGSARRGEPLNRARNIDSQFGSEQKSGKSVSSLLQPLRLIFSPHAVPWRSPVRSFFLVHRFERHSAVTWLYSLARGKGFPTSSSYGFYPFLACPSACDFTIVSATLFFRLSFLLHVTTSTRFCRNRDIYFAIIHSSINLRLKQSLDWSLRY